MSDQLTAAAVHVQDEQGRPIAGATCLESGIAHITNAGGDVSLGDLPNGLRLVGVSKEGYASVEQPFTMVFPNPQIVFVTLKSLVPVLKRPTPQNHRWLIDGKEWKWRGCTDFRLLQAYLRGEDLSPVLNQRKAAGVNLVRVLAMKANNTGWELRPDYDLGRLDAFFGLLTKAGLYCQVTVFADTKALLPDVQRQKDFWYHVGDVAVHYPNVFLDLVNEWNHSTQQINPSNFSMITGVLCSHGSGQTDQHPVEPYWQFTTYHARRDSPPSAKGFTNYGPFEFESNWQKACPAIPEEGIKPQSYNWDTGYAYLLGSHARTGCGGTYHTDAGVNSNLWNDGEAKCAKAFCEGVGQ